MKKILLVAAVAAIITAGCNKNGGNAGSGTYAADSTTIRHSGMLAYVDMDTLVYKYDMYLDLAAEFEVKAAKAEADLSSKQRSLENAIADYEEKATKGLMTQVQMRTTEESLTQRQQAFMQQREQVLTQLTDEERVMLNQIHHSIVDFLKEYNSDYRYQMILSTSAGSPVLNASPELDITREVLAGINKKYAAAQGSAR